MNRCKPCKFVGVRTSYVDRNAFVHFFEKRPTPSEAGYIIIESKMNDSKNTDNPG